MIWGIPLPHQLRNMSDNQVPNEAEFIASFLAEDHSDTTPEPEPEEAEATDESDDADDTDVDADSAAADDSEEAGDEDEDSASPTAKLDTKALTKAIDDEDPKAFIVALGKHADTLLGAKAHKALRMQAKEVRHQEQRAEKITSALMAKFGDPVAARKAAEAGDAEAFVESLEKQYGAPWAEMLKFVNASFAGKPARLEAKAKAQHAEQSAQTEAAAKVKSEIETRVKTSDAKLLKAHPKIIDLVFEKMRTEYKNGINTPAKALAAVKKELQAEHKALAKVFAAGSTESKPATKPRPPREERQSDGRKMNDEEFIKEFLREHSTNKSYRKAGK